VKANAASSLQPPPRTVAPQRVGQQLQLLVLSSASTGFVSIQMICVFHPRRFNTHQPVQRAPFCTAVPPPSGTDVARWLKRQPPYANVHGATGLWQVSHQPTQAHYSRSRQRSCHTKGAQRHIAGAAAPVAVRRWYCPAHVLGGVGLLAGAPRKPRTAFRSPHKYPPARPCGLQENWAEVPFCAWGVSLLPKCTAARLLIFSAASPE
jgi:hypothetical protein